MTRMLGLLLLMTVATPAVAAAPIISEIWAQQRRDGSRLVDVLYTLSDMDDSALRISAQASLDGGATWTVPVVTVQPMEGMSTLHFGDDVVPGSARGFVWNLGADLPDAFAPDLRIRIIASDLPRFTRLFGGDGEDVGRHIITAPDGGHLIVGSTASYGGGGNDMWLLKTDEDGVEEWRREFGYTGEEHGHHGVALPEGGYLIGATTDSWGLGDEDILLISVDEAGEYRWVRNYGDSHGDGHPRVLTLPDGDIVLGGTVSRQDFNQEGEYWHGDIYLARLDSLGTPRWEVLRDGPGGGGDGYTSWNGYDRFVAMGIGEYSRINLVSAYSYSGEYGGHSAAWYVEYTMDGDLWYHRRPFDGWYHGEGVYYTTMDFLLMPNGDRVLTGRLQTTDWPLVHAPFLYREAYVNWEVLLEELDSHIIHAIHRAVDGGILATGATRYLWGGSPQLLILRFDAEANLLWSRVYGAWTRSEGFDVVETLDGGILVTGQADDDLLLMKTDAQGNQAP